MFFCPPAITCAPPPLLLTRSKTQAPELPPAVHGRYQCPTTLSLLTTLLLRDLPSYANRATQRRRQIKDPNYSSYILAGQPSLSPIDITNPEYSPVFPQSPPQQLFISTLEQQFKDRQVIDVQRFHWLLLTYSDRGSWHLALMYSGLGKKNADAILLPPIDSSQTPLGEAVEAWLRDCRSGQIKP
jgi:hypothetical protein